MYNPGDTFTSGAAGEQCSFNTCQHGGSMSAVGCPLSAVRCPPGEEEKEVQVKHVEGCYCPKPECVKKKGYVIFY